MSNFPICTTVPYVQLSICPTVSYIQLSHVSNCPVCLTGLEQTPHHLAALDKAPGLSKVPSSHLHQELKRCYLTPAQPHLLEDIHLETVVEATKEEAVDPGEDEVAMVPLVQT